MVRSISWRGVGLCFGKGRNVKSRELATFIHVAIAGKLAIVESPALGKEVRDWSVLLKDALVETCGEDNMEVGIFKYNLSSEIGMSVHFQLSCENPS